MTLKIMQGIYSFVLVFIAGIVAKYFTDAGMVPFYDTLYKPDIVPDGKYFSYAWITIYILLFISFYIILTSQKTVEQFDDANVLFICQLFLQVLWTFSFFYMHQLVPAAIVIILLDMVVALMMHTFLFINLWSFVLLLPYLCWILFATYLNVYIAFVN